MYILRGRKEMHFPVHLRTTKRSSRKESSLLYRVGDVLGRASLGFWPLQIPPPFSSALIRHVLFFKQQKHQHLYPTSNAFHSEIKEKEEERKEREERLSLFSSKRSSQLSIFKVVIFFFNTSVEMSSAVRGGFRLPAFLRIEEELMGGDRKGIGTILGFSSAEKLRTENRKSLRRTFSADMSSKKWMAQQQQSPLKKISSSQEFSEMSVTDSSSSLSSSSSDEGEEKEEQRKDLEKRPGQMDIWNLIQSHKTADSTPTLPAPYIHPLVKRSLSKLSQKSLQICTESLGSETGADCLPIVSNASEDRNKKQEDGIVSIVEEDLKDERKQLAAVDYRHSTANRRSPTRSLPPPLPSISHSDGSRLYMRSHRKEGRLVVEAISIPPSPKCFDANRHDGRLVLSFMNTPPKEAKEEEEAVVKEEAIVAGEEEDDNEGEEVEEDGDNKKGIVLELKILQKEVAATVMKFRLSNPWMKRALEEMEDTKMRQLAPRATADQVAIVSKKAPLVVKVEEILPMMMRCMEMWPMVRLPHCIATI